jgi:hypothetical protein
MIVTLSAGRQTRLSPFDYQRGEILDLRVLEIQFYWDTNTNRRSL